MSIQKKSLINTLKSAKKANIVKEEVTVHGATVSPRVVASAKKAAPRMSTASKSAASKKAAKKSPFRPFARSIR